MPVENINIDDPEIKCLTIAYVTKLRKKIDTLREANEQEDFEYIVNIAHNMAGSGESFGIPDISKLASALESKAGQQHQESTTVLIEKLARLLQRLRVT